MGGIILAVGDGAEHAVRRGATPLQRRPWQALTVWSSARAALGFCGDRGGIAESDGTVAVVDGEITVANSLVGGKEAATHVLHAYLREGIGLRELSGQFAAAIWDEDAYTLTLVVDLLGTRPLYLARQDDVILVSSELKGLIAAGLELQLDLDGAAQLLAYEHLLGERTLLAGVRLLPPASTTVIDMGGERTINRGRYRVAPAASIDVDECVASFA